MNKRLEVLIILVLYLVTLYFWTLPIRTNPNPYGEVDASSHFAVADYMSENNKVITDLPRYIDLRYGQDNKFKEHYMWYHPPFHTNFAVMQVISGERVLPVFLFNALIASSIVLMVFFIIRKFYGFTAAFLSSFLLAFSLRDIMVYLWGQWPERIAFAYLPLVLYTFYKYSTSYLGKEKTKTQYLVLMSLFLGINFFLHPQVFFHTALALVILSVLMLIKHKKIPFSVKHISFAILLFIVLVSIFPFQTGNVIKQMTQQVSSVEDSFQASNLGRFFSWFDPIVKPNINPSYLSYNAMHGGIWTIPLFILGLVFLLKRRKDKDLVMLAWFIGYYLMIHSDIFGIGRPHRSLAGEAHIIYPLAAIGLVFLISLSQSLLKANKKIIKFSLVTIFILFIVFSNAKNTSSTLQNSYVGISRVSKLQYDAALWMKDNLPENADVLELGTILDLPKRRWIQFLSHRHINGINDPGDTNENIMPSTHVMMDYSDLVLLQGNPQYKAELDALVNLEREQLINQTLLYNQDNIRVYKIG